MKKIIILSAVMISCLASCDKDDQIVCSKATVDTQIVDELSQQNPQSYEPYKYETDQNNK